MRNDRRKPRYFAAMLMICLAVMAGAQVQKAPLTRPEDNAPDWWKHAVIYEVYPRSFQDSNGDGVGDLKGITERLDYLRSLGVDTIWISPMYPYAQVDFGYDISNYEAIDPQYGTMADFDELVRQTRLRAMHVILDAVMNHTSDQHPWFVESRASRTSAKRDWYVWADGRNGGPPNNWTSGFGGSAWELDPKTNQFYYHNFYKQQPDLNWRNPEVHQAMESMLRFWLDKGVSGFRLDAILTLFEDPSLKDAKLLGGTTPYGEPRVDHSQQNNLPEVHGVLRDLRHLVDKYPGHPVLIGEDYLTTPEKLHELYGAHEDELQLPMDMQLGFIDKLDVARFRKAISDSEDGLGGNQPLFVFDNHDKHRSWDRYGDGIHNDAIARIIATILLTTRATPMLYEGQEIGMTTSTPTRREDVQDPIGIRGWPAVKGRDGERTPMQWDSSKNAGFSTAAKTWLPVAINFRQVNVASEAADPKSLLNWYKSLLALRRSNIALRDGETTIFANDPDVLAFARTASSVSVLVLNNFSNHGVDYRLSDGKAAGRRLLSSAGAEARDGQVVHLPPYAVWVGELSVSTKP
jgi:alpha-glucosidase